MRGRPSEAFSPRNRSMLRVAIIGQGRSGRDIHGAYFRSEANTRYKVVAVVDELENRRARAAEEYGCPVYASYEELFAHRDEIDLVVNSTFSYQHAAIAADLMRHGFDVVTEKPLAKHAEDVEMLIRTAAETGRMIAPFQQSRYAPYFLKIREVLASGVLGRVLQNSIQFSGFSRRWDWQCSLRYNGGGVMNTGPHPMDQALELFGYDAEPRLLYSKLDRANIAGDAEDYAKILFSGENKPLFDIEISSCNAYAPYLYVIQATNGSLRANYSTVEWQWFDPNEAPLPALQLRPLGKPDTDLPAYCGETLNWHKESCDLKGSAFTTAVDAYYGMIHRHLTEGAPLEITAEQVLRQIRLNEQIHADNPLPVLY